MEDRRHEMRDNEEAIENQLPQVLAYSTPFNSVISLYQLSLSYIINNVTDVIELHENRNIYFSTLTSHLSSKICLDITKHLAMNNKRKYIPSFCKYGMDTLNITGFNREFRIEDIAHVLQRITTITFAFSSCSVEHLNILIYNLTNVINLNLSYTNTSDALLEIIATYCPRLRSLDISHCPITDFGLILLCHKRFDSTQKRCQSLKYLIIFNSAEFTSARFTISGLCYVLNHLQLYQLNVAPIFQTMTVVNYINQQPNSILLLQLLNLYSTTRLNIRKILSTTPLLTDLCLYEVVIFIDDIIYLPKLKHLIKFSLCLKRQNNDFNFRGLELFLDKSGESLIELRLKNFNFVGISSIGLRCKQLQLLKLSSIYLLDYNAEIAENTTSLFPHLAELFFHDLNYCNHITWINLLMNCPHLTRLILSSSERLDGNWLNKIIPFLKELRIFYFYDCYHIEKHSIFKIIESLSDLVSLKITTETKILSRNDLNEIIDFIRSEGSKVQFSYEDHLIDGNYEIYYFNYMFFIDYIDKIQ